MAKSHQPKNNKLEFKILFIKIINSKILVKRNLIFTKQPSWPNW